MLSAQRVLVAPGTILDSSSVCSKTLTLPPVLEHLYVNVTVTGVAYGQADRSGRRGLEDHVRYVVFVPFKASGATDGPAASVEDALAAPGRCGLRRRRNLGILDDPAAIVVDQGLRGARLEWTFRRGDPEQKSEAQHDGDEKWAPGLHDVISLECLSEKNDQVLSGKGMETTHACCFLRVNVDTFRITGDVTRPVPESSGEHGAFHAPSLSSSRATTRTGEPSRPVSASGVAMS